MTMTMTSRSLLSSLALIVLLNVGCAPADDGESTGGAMPTNPSTSSAATGPAFARPAQVQLDYVLYLDRPAPHRHMQLRRIVARAGSEVAIITSAQEAANWPASLRMDDSPSVIADAPPPDAETLRLFGKDLSAEQIERAASARHAIQLSFVHRSDSAIASLARADHITLALAEQLDAFIADTQARWVYSAGSWKAQRFAADGSARSDVLAHVAVHSYRDGELIRSVSVGMQKFALPDLTMDGLSHSTGDALGWVLSGILQRLIEGQAPEADGDFDFDVRAIAEARVRQAIEADAFPNAGWQGRFALRPSTPQEGDAENVLLMVSFDHFEGADQPARRASAAGQIMGWSSEMKNIRHDQELELASQQARAQLPDLRSRFQAGLQPGDRLLVKAPFATAQGGHEWMWVEVTAWEQARIIGILNSTPFDIPDLHRGQRVEVVMDDVFDYLLTYADGSEEGNATGKIIERMQGEVRKQGAQ